MFTFVNHYLDFGLDMQDVHVEITGLPANIFVIMYEKHPFWLERERISLFSWAKGQILNMNYISLDIEWWKMKVCISLLPFLCSPPPILPTELFNNNKLQKLQKGKGE